MNTLPYSNASTRIYPADRAPEIKSHEVESLWRARNEELDECIKQYWNDNQVNISDAMTPLNAGWIEKIVDAVLSVYKMSPYEDEDIDYEDHIFAKLFIMTHFSFPSHVYKSEEAFKKHLIAKFYDCREETHDFASLYSLSTLLADSGVSINHDTMLRAVEIMKCVCNEAIEANREE